MRDLTHLTRLLPAIDRLIEATSPESMDRSLRPLERRLRDALAAMWAEQRRLTLERLSQHARRFSEAGPVPDDQFDALWLAVSVATADAMVDLLNEIGPVAMRRGHRAALRDIGTGLGIRFDLRHQRAVQFLRDYGADRVSGINATTRTQLRALLVQAGANGWSYSRASRLIRGMFAGFATRAPQRHLRDRGELVATTEMAQAYGAGQRMARDQIMAGGVALEHMWMTAGGSRVDGVCLSNEAAGWIPATEPFPSGHFAEPAHPACRCVTSARVAESSRVLATA